MTVPTTSWDENSPAGSQSILLGDNRIREMKTQVREVVDIDHKFDSSGQDADMGKHNQVSLIESADIGSGEEGLPILGAQTIDGKAELVFTTEGDADIQMSKGDYPYFSAPENVAGMAGLLGFIYPIGYVITLGVSTNPGTLLGVGTWTAIEGKVIVGIAGSGTFDTLNATGGAETHELTEAELAAHTHTYDKPVASSDRGPEAHSALRGTSSTATGSTGSGDGHNNLQPYITKYCWQRTS